MVLTEVLQALAASLVLSCGDEHCQLSLYQFSSVQKKVARRDPYLASSELDVLQDDLEVCASSAISDLTACEMRLEKC